VERRKVAKRKKKNKEIISRTVSMPKLWSVETKKRYHSCYYTYNILVQMNTNLTNVLTMQEKEIKEKAMVSC
jgi:hypothetical protein